MAVVPLIVMPPVSVSLMLFRVTMTSWVPTLPAASVALSLTM